MMEKFEYSAEELSLIENSLVPIGVYQFIDKRIVAVALSKGFCKLFGYDDISKAYFDMDHDMYKNTHIDDYARIVNAGCEFALDKAPYDVVYRSKIPNSDDYRIIHAKGEHIYVKPGVRLAQVWYIDEGLYEDKTDSSCQELTGLLKNSLYESNLLKLSNYDHLTGLPGMTYFFELAVEKRRAIERDGGDPAMLFMDFSGMKYFNHKFGFASGDRLLQLFSRVLADKFGNENCSRFGQDHFAIVTESADLEDRLNDLFCEVNKLDEGRTLPLHVGIFLHWHEGIVVSAACDRAKIACDKLKNIYDSRFGYYNMSMKDAEDKQQYIIANFDKAMKEGWIRAWYQPIVRSVSGRVCDEEALARWIDPVVGFMSPADFVPVLEEHRIIYKLDLFMVECIIKKIQTLSQEGLHIMPQSVNLSRSDFEICDMVEEVRRRVDDAGLPHELLTIEITESTVASDFDFMKTQIERFSALGFPVWMDDFGSGYSSLDVLQSLKFDLIKFDMRFMQQFSKENAKGKIILTDMVRMVTSLGIDTVCEGVETAEQVEFLNEIGCAKLQGYYYEKPVPVERILEKYRLGIQIGFEDPLESRYYEEVGRVNMHDLSFISQGDTGTLDDISNTIPMAIIELVNGKASYTRSNKAYRDFMVKYFGRSVEKINELAKNDDPAEENKGEEHGFITALVSTRHTTENVFVNERLYDGTCIHACMRRVAFNEKNGTSATAVAVLSIISSEQGTTYDSIARALVADFFKLYYVNITDDSFYEYSSGVGKTDLTMERKSENFFHESRKDALGVIYKDDREIFIDTFRKEKILAKLDEQGAFTHTYRMISNGKPKYVSMKVMRMQGDKDHIIVGVRNVDAIIRRRIMMDKVRRNESILVRLMALSNEYICMYTVEPETEEYVEVNSANNYKELGLASTGSYFFTKALENKLNTVAPEDHVLFDKYFNKETVLSTIAKDGVFTINYHLIINDKMLPVTLRAVIAHEYDGDKLIIGVSKQDHALHL